MAAAVSPIDVEVVATTLSSAPPEEVRLASRYTCAWRASPTSFHADLPPRASITAASSGSSSAQITPTSDPKLSALAVVESVKPLSALRCSTPLSVKRQWSGAFVVGVTYALYARRLALTFVGDFAPKCSLSRPEI